MWDFFAEVFKQTGIIGLFSIIEAIVLVFLVRIYHTKDRRVDQLQKDLLSMSEKRLEDVVEEREKYEELSQDLNKSTNLLIQVFKKKSGLNGD